MKKYKVWMVLRSMSASYDGYVDVCAENEDEAILKAKQKLKRTSFPDYSFDMMHVEKVERDFTGH